MDGGAPAPASFKFYYFLILAAAAALAFAIVGAIGLDGEGIAFWFGEDRVVELASAAGYVVCALLLLGLGGWAFSLRNWNLILLLLALCSRELDFDKKFTTDGIFKSAFYVSPDVPMVEKLAAVAVILLLGWAVVKFAVEHLDSVAKALLALHPAAIGGVLALVCMAVSKTFDGSVRKLASWGIEIPGEWGHWLTLTEEILELGISVFFIIAAIAYFGTRRSTAAPGLAE